MCRRCAHSSSPHAPWPRRSPIWRPGPRPLRTWSLGAPIPEVAGPREENLVEAAGLLVSRRGDALRIEGVPVPAAFYGDLYESGALLPGPHAILAGPTFEEWLDANVGRARGTARRVPVPPSPASAPISPLHQESATQQGELSPGEPGKEKIMRVFVAGRAAQSGVARPAADRCRTRSDRHPPLARERRAAAGAGREARPGSTCSTRAPCARPCSSTSPRRSSTRRPHSRT